MCACVCARGDMATSLEDKLTRAAAQGNTAHVEDLLRAGAQVNGVNCFGRTALQVSVTQRNNNNKKHLNVLDRGNIFKLLE